MKIITILLVFKISIISTETIVNKDVTIVELVINGLKDQTWSESERPCLEQTLKILDNVRNYTVWAVWIWNSMHQPVGTFYGSEYSLGNYDQCLKAPSLSADPEIITQYCLAEVTLTSNKFRGDSRNVLGSTEPYVAVKTPIGRNLNKVTWGTCLPSVCKATAISKVLKSIYLTNPLTPAVPDIRVDSCDQAGADREFSTGFYAFMSLIITLITVSIFSTYYLQYGTSKCKVMQGITESFCLKRNWTSLTKKTDDDIGMLSVLKITMAFFAVSVHTAFFEIMSPYSNGIDFDEILLNTKNPILNAVKHIDLPVDNFLMVSGLLLVKGLMDKRKKPLVALVNRYFRLITSFAVVMFYVAAVSIYTGNGPTWKKFASREQNACQENWWLGLLMLNNYVNSDNICLMVSWYIPCDYQLAIMGTILYMIWQKDRGLAKIITIITVVLALVMPGLVTYFRKLPGAVLFHDLEKIVDFRKNDVYLDTYIRSHNRAGPYLIGMAMGYIMSVYKPQKYRNVISKERCILLIVVSSIIACRVATAPLSWTTLEYDHLSLAIYAVSSRNLWAFATCLTIIVVEYGDVDGLRELTSWHGFTVMSRLAYGIYLTHSIILQQNMYSRKNLQQFDLIYTETVRSCGVMVASAVAAIFLWLFVEAPLNNMVNSIISGRQDTSHRSTNSKTKGTSTEPDHEINNKIKGI